MILCDYCGEQYDPATDPPFQRITVSGMNGNSVPVLDLQIHAECVTILADDLKAKAGKGKRPKRDNPPPRPGIAVSTGPAIIRST